MAVGCTVWVVDEAKAETEVGNGDVDVVDVDEKKLKDCEVAGADV